MAEHEGTANELGGPTTAQDTPFNITNVGGRAHQGDDNFQPRAEDLFNVPLDNQSKNTADGEFSPQATDEDSAWAHIRSHFEQLPLDDVCYYLGIFDICGFENSNDILY